MRSAPPISTREPYRRPDARATRQRVGDYDRRVRPRPAATLRAVLAVHATLAIFVIAANLLALGWGVVYLVRKRLPGRVYAHVLAGAQSVVIAQVAVGLLLLSDGRRTADDLHYAYGTFALLAVLSPWLYAPPVPARRLLWFVGASLFAAALSVRAYTTSA
jgi:hypothetical protein